MHELSMADGILKASLKTAEENDATEILEVTIELGKMTLLNPEQLTFLLSVLCEDTIAKNAKFNIVEIPIEIECKDCDFTGDINSDDLDHYIPIIECPNCSSKRLNVLNGKECSVKNVIIEKPDD
ncbi:MAG: hydrogenase maturation nickel metallochaperone HypA [Methanobacteriaceae archaeon]